MKVLDLGTGYEPATQLPGADLCCGNLTEEDIEECKSVGAITDQVIYLQHASTENPTPAEDKEYDMVWYSFGLYSCSFGERQSIADEIDRITKDRSTLIIKDYNQWYDPEKDELITVSVREWLTNMKQVFSKWVFATVSIEIDDENVHSFQHYDEAGSGIFQMILILKKGWG